ncbi:hypothetical protein KAR91_87515 [Candidatus Pacearchaeota archaeon]|nr:hypothetical protein [Candidatus Pacearchaeota archaeon]
MKRQTKLQKYKDLANAIGQIRRGEPVKRIGAKDGSIRTHAVVSVDPKKLEHEVLADCLSWLKKHHVFCNRHDAGTFQNERGQYGTYGIIGAGDIIGMIGEYGTHLEIECKRGSGGKFDVKQQKRQRDVNRANGIYYVVHGVEELKHYLGVII